LKLRCPTVPFNATITNNHLEPLQGLSRDLQAGAQALRNAYELGTGYDDLAVILLEPSDKADSVFFEEMLESSPALKAVDESLRHAFAGMRDIRNTIILDIRAFRSNRIRQTQPSIERLADDERAYSTFKQIISRLKPDVILVCQCQTGTEEVKNDFAQRVCSSVKEATNVSVVEISGTEHHSVMIKSFHPMYLKYQREPPGDTLTQKVMREYLFDAGFIVAGNALVGQRVKGVGLSNLRASAETGPVMIPTSQGPLVSYQFWGEEDDYLSSDQLEELESMKKPCEVGSVTKYTAQLG
jgi:hypothetical protein